MKDTLKKIWSHPMAPFAAVYYGGFAVATCIFGPVALIHPAATTLILAAFLGACKNSERKSCRWHRHGEKCINNWF